MSDEEYDDEDEEEDEEGLSDEERKKRRRLRELKEKAKKFLEKSSHGNIPEGFMDAFGGQENAHKYYKHHDFKFTAEPKTPIPEVKPSAVSGDNWKEPQRWYPHISPVENKQHDSDEPSNKLFRFMEVLSEDERREVWNIFYRQANGLEEPTHEELERIESEAKLDFADVKNETIAIETPIDPSFGRTIFDPEPSDQDILNAEKLRKLGHGHGKCIPVDSLEEGYDV